ncbi:RICIN domain-containing protein [Streptacidiphilus carbonis]|uniref:RICIN domain-containing protein n=1 Tax=Streptacidiphilus carbonis TaxID=105422 RepID=UPI0007C7BB03|nr:RICIN domain-containing protein [Streptacidiphilus carbonis]
MSRTPATIGRRRSTRAALVTAVTLGALAAAPITVSQAATATTLYASPTGSGTACSSSAPCSLTQAKASVEAVDKNMSGDIVVQLAGGTYRLSAPLTLGTTDSGSNGHSVIWQAAPGQTPVLSGGQQITGWSLHDAANNIYAAPVPTGADSRQLYVDGALAPRAAIGINRSDVAVTATGLTIKNSALNYLASLPEQNRIELESQNSFTDRYAPVQSISGTNVSMQQPAWNNNNWGYDTLASPFAGGGLQLENSYSFLKNTGQWYLDPQAGQLYYKAPSGWNPTAHDVELPRLTSLVQISGGYSAPAHDIAFQGVAFEHTTWLGPSTNIGYADQQSGTFLAQTYQQPSNFLTSCQSGCQQFEATRNTWNQVPAAVQVSAASNVAFTGDTFTHLGQVGLGIGNDNDATASGTGLGASGISVTRSTFSDDSGSGIVVGGVQPNAHHPTDPAMTDQNITVQDDLITGVAEDYKDMAGILSTYVTHAVITHNEVSDLGYDGIDVGWGWGANDQGGSQDYVNRGLYNYQPVYSTPTTLKNTVVSYNKVHGTKRIFHDGGSIYNLSANPGASIDHNYIYDNQFTVGLYLDEGSRYVTLADNVVQDTGVWAFTNANANNNTDDNAFTDNWYNGGATNVATGAPHNNTLTGNVQVSGTNWPSGAQQVIAQAGPEPTTGGGFPGGYHQLVVASDALCLDVYGNSGNSGAAIDQWTCNGQANQQFQFVPLSGGYGELQAQNSGQDVAVAGSSTTQGTPDIVQQPVSGSAAGLWLPQQQSDGSWQFKNQNSGLCLDVYGAGANTGQQLDQWPCKNAPGSNQDFTAR